MYLNEMIKKTLFNFHNKSLKSEVLLNIHTNSLEKIFFKKKSPKYFGKRIKKCGTNQPVASESKNMQEYW